MVNFSADHPSNVFSSITKESTQVNMRFARNFDESKYDEVYTTIKESFADFPARSTQKIEFNVNKEVDRLKIILKVDKVKIKYSSKRKKSPLGKTSSNLIKTLGKL